MTGHVVVQTEAVVPRLREGAAHQDAGIRKRRGPVRGVLGAHLLPRHGVEPVGGADVPLAPMAQTAQLDEADEVVAAVALSQRGHHPLMAGDELGVAVIRRKAAAAGIVVGRARAAGLFPEPVGDVSVRLVAGQVTHKAKHDVLALGAPALQLVLLFDGVPVEHALLRLQLAPCDVHVQQRHVLGYVFVPRRGRIAHQRVAERLAAVGKITLQPAALPPEQQRRGRGHRRRTDQNRPSFPAHRHTSAASPCLLPQYTLFSEALSRRFWGNDASD